MNRNIYSREASLRKYRAERAAARRRKRLTGVVAVALVGVLAVGGTVAWLVDEADPVTNTFVPATVMTDIIEDDFDGASKKNVSIKNLQTPDTNVPAYIRAKVVVNWAKVDANGNVTSIYGAGPTLGADYTDWTANAKAAGWVEYGGYYYWTLPVNPGASTRTLIEEIKVSEGVTPPDGYVLNVEILSEAIQSKGTTAAGVPAVSDAWGVIISQGSVTAYVASADE